jgi:cobalt-zinc-cadmium efflux system membrane fusion protein
VFVQDNPAQPHFTLRRVELTHRFDKTAFVRSVLPKDRPVLTAEEKAEGLLPRELLKPGARVLTTGVLELKKELEDRQAKSEQ